MAITYEDIIPSLIENTTMRKLLLDGVHRTYNIKAVDGYVLHDKALDAPAIDEYGEPTEEIALGYTRGTCSCGASYDFTVNSREFYAVLTDTVPENQIFGADNDHKIM